MSISQLPNGRYRAQVWDKRAGKTVAVRKILKDEPATYATKREAKKAREKARDWIDEHAGIEGPTLRAFAERWTSDRLFSRPKESTDLQNHWAVREFVNEYGHFTISQIGHREVAAYLAGGGGRTARVGALRAMFNDAASPKAGRLVAVNPFEKLGLARSRGNRHEEPPSEKTVRALIAAAREKGGPDWAAWLQVACYTGLRPGELDGLKWECVDLEGGRIIVRRQFNARTRGMTLPKNGKVRPALLTPPAREALEMLPRSEGFCFRAPRGGHYTPGARRGPWKRTREAVGYERTLYLATRHHAGSYMVNTLGLDSEDVAYALGHEDGGELVRTLYGHRSREAALARVQAAFEAVGA